LGSLRSSLSRSRWILLSAAMTAVAFCGYLGWSHFYGNDIGTAASNEAKGLPKIAAVPVTIAQAAKADFPVYLNGLGAVEPYQTVLVRSRVDGEVIKIDFKQGQMVKKGDVLVEIDPRPYQAALDQAVAKKAQDEASLKNAPRRIRFRIRGSTRNRRRSMNSSRRSRAIRGLSTALKRR
jgi:membrane fusion protein, multidrug efflux system